jgi:hypothetical protein
MFRTHDELELVHDTGRHTPLARPQHVSTNDGNVDLAIA